MFQRIRIRQWIRIQRPYNDDPTAKDPLNHLVNTNHMVYLVNT